MTQSNNPAKIVNPRTMTVQLQFTPEQARAARDEVRASMNALIKGWMALDPNNNNKLCDFKQWCSLNAYDSAVYHTQQLYEVHGFTGRKGYRGYPYNFWQFNTLNTWIGGMKDLMLIQPKGNYTRLVIAPITAAKVKPADSAPLQTTLPVKDTTVDVGMAHSRVTFTISPTKAFEVVVEAEVMVHLDVSGKCSDCELLEYEYKEIVGQRNNPTWFVNNPHGNTHNAIQHLLSAWMSLAELEQLDEDITCTAQELAKHKMQALHAEIAKPAPVLHKLTFGEMQELMLKAVHMMLRVNPKSRLISLEVDPTVHVAINEIAIAREMAEAIHCCTDLYLNA